MKSHRFCRSLPLHISQLNDLGLFGNLGPAL